jgi:hypothetical protein
MTRFLKAALFATLVSAVCLTANLNAQTGPSQAPTNSQTPGPSVRSLALRDLYKALKTVDEGVKARLMIDRDTKQLLGVRFSLIVNRGKQEEHRVIIVAPLDGHPVTLSVPLTAKHNAFPADLAQRLVEVNGKLAPCKIVCRRNGDTSMLMAELKTSPATVQALLDSMKQLVQSVESARPFWGRYR